MFTFAYFLNDDGDDGFDKRQMGARYKCEPDRLGYSWACSLSALETYTEQQIQVLDNEICQTELSS